MKLGECNFEVEDDGLYRTTPISPNVSQKELIMPKEIFIECFRKWISCCGRNENCPNKDTCYDYNTWNCIGCNENMRDATEEELKSTSDYIKSISKPTGVNFFEQQEAVDYVSREEVMKILHTMYAVDRLEELKIMQQKVRELPSIYVLKLSCTRFRPNCGAQMEVE